MMQSTAAYFREVTEKDLDLLYEWANDKTVRTNAFSTEPIPYANHKEWFISKLQDSNTKIYIYMYEEQPVGQIRIDIEGNEAKIDYSIDAQYRKQGHGKRMLKLLEQRLKGQMPKIECLFAQVKCENETSKAAFTASGYQEQYVTYHKKMK